MPTVKLNKEVFEGLVGKKLPLDKLKERISYLGTDLESIEGNEISVEVFPNRPDLLSEQGFARAFSSFIGVKRGLRKYNIKKSECKVKIESSVNSVRPFTACALVKNLKFDNEKIKEIIQIQEKLHITYGRNRRKAAIGIYPIEKIKPPIYYKALPPEKIKFKPLESNKEMTGLQILSQHPTGREYGYLLEGKDKFPIFIDSNNKILSMPPIINSDETGKITNKTKEVFVECSGSDFQTLNILLNIIVTALADMGGEIYSMGLEYPNEKYTTPNLNPTKMKIKRDYINRLIGLDFKESELKKLFERMGCSYVKGTVLIPAYRADILHPIDLVEEIAIAYGYENFKPEIQSISTTGKESKFEVFKRKIREVLIGYGLMETSSFIITSKQIVEEENKDHRLIEIKNPLSKEFNVLRTDLLSSTLQTISKNQHNEFPQKIFEIGTIFDFENQKENLAIALSHEKANFTEMKQILDSFISLLGLKYEIQETQHNSFIEGRVGRILVNNKKIGYIGEINPKVLRNFGLEMPVTCMEINLDELFEIKTS